MFEIATTLLLIPTELERQRLARFADWPAYEKHVHVCGFGPIAAAASTAALVERLRPRRALLLGIAGTYNAERLPLGEAALFESVVIDGIGAGTGGEFVSAEEMGFPLTGDVGGLPTRDDALPLDVPAGENGCGRLLTVCSASVGVEFARQRSLRFPGAIAEDMEGFSVALACRSADVPLTVVRGISNLAGNRDSGHWHIDAALESAWRVCRKFLA